jgi:glucose-1-phosphate adenylyltransferase
VAVFGGDHIYKMDVTQMINFHRMNRADITIAALEVPAEEASRFGVFSVDEDARITVLPKNPRIRNGSGRTCFASMGSTFSHPEADRSAAGGTHADLDFGKHVIPMMLEKGDRCLPTISTTM